VRSENGRLGEGSLDLLRNTDISPHLPPRTNFEKLQDILMKRKGMTLDVSSSGALAASLDQCLDPSEPTFNTLVRIMTTRCMLSAEYFCSGSSGHVRPFGMSYFDYL